MLLLSLALAGAISNSEPATAQAVLDDTIVVEGQRRLSERQALRTVTDMTMIVESQIARFHWQVCPMVVGLQQPAAAIVEQRMRETARNVGAWIDRPRCEANLVLFVAGDGAKLFADLQHERPSWFSSTSKPETRKILKESPARAFQQIQNRVPRGSSLLRPWWFSNFQNATVYNIEGAVVILDADAIEGLTLRQVADYAVMRGLAKIDPPDNLRTLDSILSIFDKPKDMGPRELTEFDQRYLRELYEHLDNKGLERSVFERQRLARAIAAED